MLGIKEAQSAKARREIRKDIKKNITIALT
jgi:hypothetical protein